MRGEVHIRDLPERRAVDVVRGWTRQCVVAAGCRVQEKRRVVHEVEQVEVEIQVMTLPDDERFLHGRVERPLPRAGETASLQIADLSRAGVEKDLPREGSGPW